MPNNKKQFGVILLAGGQGTRIGGTIPKQFLPLKGKPIVRHSFDFFCKHPHVSHVVVVASPQFRHFFETHENVSFALPGERRQDSVYNGLQALKSDCPFVCVHDAARPFISQPLIDRLFSAAEKYGAVAPGLPVSFTIKECDQHEKVLNTKDRTHLREIQTPQVIRRDWLDEGFALAHSQHKEVTDDVSLVEMIQRPVHIVEGCSKNLKITIPRDLAFAEFLSHHDV